MRILKFLFLVSCGMAAAAICRADVILSVSPSLQTVASGSSVQFTVNVSGLGAGTALGAYDIQFGFDPAVLSYQSTTFGGQLDVLGLGDIQVASAAPNYIDLFELSLDSAADLNALQASAFSLATLTFNSLTAASNSPLTLGLNAVGDENGVPINPVLQNGSLTVLATPAPVPEPSSLLLVLGAIPAYVAHRIALKLASERQSAQGAA